MQWEDFAAFVGDGEEQYESTIDLDLSLLSKPKDYYRILEVKYDANEECIRSNYIRLALKWHPDKKKVEDCSSSRFQEINEAYKGLRLLDELDIREEEKQNRLDREEKIRRKENMREHE